MDYDDEYITIKIDPWSQESGEESYIRKTDKDWHDDLKHSGFVKEFQLLDYEEYLLEINVYKNPYGRWLIDFWGRYQISVISCKDEKEKIECLKYFIGIAKNLIFIQQQTQKFRI